MAYKYKEGQVELMILTPGANAIKLFTAVSYNLLG